MMAYQVSHPELVQKTAQRIVLDVESVLLSNILQMCLAQFPPGKVRPSKFASVMTTISARTAP